MLIADVIDSKNRRARRREWLRRNQPSMDDLECWAFDSVCEAACECGATVEPDGYCEHGNPSWLLHYGLI